LGFNINDKPKNPMTHFHEATALYKDPHPTDEGYALIAKLINKTYDRGYRKLSNIWYWFVKNIFRVQGDGSLVLLE
jgi:hypothetical protein